MNVLIVEDDALLASGLQSALTMADYKVTHAADGGSANTNIQHCDYDLVILDLGLPDMDGLEVLNNIRVKKLPLPVLVLTARDGMDQQIAALDAGADDYMEKPFDLRELHARVKALLRRSHIQFNKELHLGPLTLDPFSRRLSLNGTVQDLPAREFEILESLMLNSPRVVSKVRLAQRLAQDNEDIGDNAVEVYIHRMRRRLKDSGVVIHTIRNVGYAIEEK